MQKTEVKKRRAVTKSTGPYVGLFLVLLLLLTLGSSKPWSTSTPLENFNSTSSTATHNVRQFFLDANVVSYNSGCQIVQDSEADSNMYPPYYYVIKFDDQYDYAKYTISSSDVEDGLYKVYITFKTSKPSGTYGIGVDDGSLDNWKEYWYLDLSKRESGDEYTTVYAGTIHFYDDASSYQVGIFRTDATYDLYIDEITFSAW